ncbi:hypothetical protein D3C75_1175910 [compost metagenome]
MAVFQKGFGTGFFGKGADGFQNDGVGIVKGLDHAHFDNGGKLAVIFHHIGQVDVGGDKGAFAHAGID